MILNQFNRKNRQSHNELTNTINGKIVDFVFLKRGSAEIDNGSEPWGWGIGIIYLPFFAR